MSTSSCGLPAAWSAFSQPADPAPVLLSQLADADLAAFKVLDAEMEHSRLKLMDWDLDAWALSDAECTRLLAQMFHSQDLLRLFLLPPTKMAAFQDLVRCHYWSNPFHCFRHAFTVTHTAWRFLTLSDVLRDKLQDIDRLVRKICLSLA